MNFLFSVFVAVFFALLVSLRSRNTNKLQKYCCWNNSFCGLHIEVLPKSAISSKFLEIVTHFSPENSISSNSSESQVIFFDKSTQLRNRCFDLCITILIVSKNPQRPFFYEHRYSNSIFSETRGFISSSMVSSGNSIFVERKFRLKTP